MTRRTLPLLGLLSLVTTTGCATLTAPKTTSMYVSANVPNAEIRVDGAVHGRTNGSVSFDRSRAPTIEVSAPGYQAQSCHPRMSAGTGYLAADAALCILFFPLGCISFIDAGGAWNEPDQGSCSVTLNPAPGTEAWAAQYAPPVPPAPSVQPGPRPVAAAQPSVAGYQPPPGYQLVLVQPPPTPPPGYMLVPVQSAR